MESLLLSPASPCQHLPRSHFGSAPAHPGDLSGGPALPGECAEQFWPADIPVTLRNGPADTHRDDDHDSLMLALVAGEVSLQHIETEEVALLAPNSAPVANC